MASAAVRRRIGIALLLGGLLALGAGRAHAQSAPDTRIASLPAVTIEQPAMVDPTASAATTEQSVDAPGDPKPAAPRTAHRIPIRTIDTTMLSAPLTDAGARVPAAAAMVMEARATALRPAPLPDQDVDAPGPDAQTLASQQEASLSPSVYGNADHFSGDGFSSGSNLESDKNNRRRPGGGMSLSIPVQ